MLKLLIIFLHLTLLSCLVGIHHAQTTTTSPFSIKPNTGKIKSEIFAFCCPHFLILLF